MMLHYPSRPLTQIQPDRLAVQLRLRGLQPPAVATARVLELGCSDAGNLAALAAYAPEATFVGVDIDEHSVALAQRHGLSNLEVLCADLRDLDLGEFDYVMAHGVLSWLPEPDWLFDCLARHLAPNGAGYVSYDCLPGAHLRMMAGEVLRREAPGDVARAREVMAFIEHAQVDTPDAQVMRVAMSRAQRKPDHVLVHDELQPLHTPFFVSDVAAALTARGMCYAGEAHLADCADLPGLPPDPVAAEQWSDYATARPFRQSVVSREEPAAVRSAAIRDVFVSCRVNRSGDEFELLRGVRVQAQGVLAADLQRLGEVWPGSLPGSELQADPEALLALYRVRGIDLRTAPVAATGLTEFPYVVAYMRRRKDLTTCRHEPLRLDDAAAIRAVSHMDGTASLAQIAQRVDARVGDLRALAEALGEAGLFVSPPAATAC